MNKPTIAITMGADANDPVCRRYAYPFVPYKALYLFAHYFAAGALVYVAVFGIQSRDLLFTSLALLMTLPMLVVICLSAIYEQAELPVEIRIEGQWISLYRFRRYRRFRLDSVVSVLLDQQTIYTQPGTGGWMVVEYEANGEREQIYVGPFISGFLELVDILQEAVGDAALDDTQDSPSNAGATKSVFCWARSMRFVSVIFGPLMIGIGISFAVHTLQSPLSMRVIFDTTLFIGAIVSGIGAMTRKVPVCVEIGNESITFRYAIRSATEVRFSDIVGFDTGGRLGRFGTKVSSASIRLQNGKKLILLTYFEDYPGLVKMLQAKLAEHQGTSVT